MTTAYQQLNLIFGEKLLKSEKISQNGNALEIPVFKGERTPFNIYELPLNSDGTIKQSFYDADYLAMVKNTREEQPEKAKEIDFFKLKNIQAISQQSEFNLDHYLGSDSLHNANTVFITAHPLDRLTLVACKQAAINLPLIVLEQLSTDNTNFFTLLKNKLRELKELSRIQIVLPNLHNRDELHDLIKQELLEFEKFLCYTEVESLGKVFQVETGALFHLSPYIAYTSKTDRAVKLEYFVHQLKLSGQPFPVAGVLLLKNFTKQIMEAYQKGTSTSSVSTGWDNLDRYYRPQPQQFLVVYGMPDSGKTTFINNFSFNLAKKNGWRTVFCQFESSAEKFYLDIISTGLRENLTYGNELTDKKSQQIQELINFCGQHFFFLELRKHFVPDDNKSFVDYMLDKFTTLIDQHEINHIVIDPWNKVMTGRPKHLSESEYLTQCLNKLEEFSKHHEILITVVTHPVKQQTSVFNDDRFVIPHPYDISGGAQWYNQADVILCIHRISDLFKRTQLDKITQIQIQKAKHGMGTKGMTFLSSVNNSITLEDNINEKKFIEYLLSEKQEERTLIDFIRKDVVKNAIDPEATVTQLPLSQLGTSSTPLSHMETAKKFFAQKTPENPDGEQQDGKTGIPF